VDGPLLDPVRPEHDRPPQDLSSGSKRFAASVACLAAAAAVAGCGDGSAQSVIPGGDPVPSGTLRIATPDRPATLDPLLATTPADRHVTAQIYEPLTRSVSGPYGQAPSEPGLALSARPGQGGTIWRVRLRPGVRFADGARLNAAAVLENAMRWQATVEGQALLPGLAAADAPRPDLVRFIFDRPVADLSRRLASARLGVVSPRALRLPGASTRLDAGAAAGTGPFELHRSEAREVILARNPQWWGTRRELGPGVDLVVMRFPQAAGRRVALLQRGTVQVAEGLGADELRAVRRDPLLEALPDRSGGLGLSRAVRGFATGPGTPMFSSVWLTTVGTGEG
jgi:peptide/nickel transport system substrate-binding protein